MPIRNRRDRALRTRRHSRCIKLAAQRFGFGAGGLQFG